MARLKVMSIVGTRPEAVKMAPIIQALEVREEIESVVCATAQHREMLDQVLELFGIVPEHDLNLMRPNQTLTQVSSSILATIEPVLAAERPDWILVQGDTTTVALAALAAFYARVKVGHVEAGLRTFDKWQPYPEEINRRMAGVIADLHFAPTERARQNLLREGVPAETVLVTGNPVIDALHWAVKRPLAFDPVQAPIFEPERYADKRLILVTAHRRENFGQPFVDICEALKRLAERYADSVHIVYPVHLNPNVQDTVYPRLGDVPNITLTAPMDYHPLVHLMKRAYLVITDSGGIQEEAPGLGVPVLVLRRTTERPEAVDVGTVKLVGTDVDLIVGEASTLLDDAAAYGKMSQATNPYGDGRAAARIVAALLGEGVEAFKPEK